MGAGRGSLGCAALCGSGATLITAATRDGGPWLRHLSRKTCGQMPTDKLAAFTASFLSAANRLLCASRVLLLFCMLISF